MSCINAPVVVAELDMPGQTGPITPTTLFTPSAAGLYRITIVVQNVTSGYVPGWQLSWADGTGSQSVPAGLSTSYFGSPVGFQNYTFPFYAVPGTAVQIAPNFSTSINYDLYILVEAL